MAQTLDEPIAIGRARPASLWRNRDFLLLWFGQAISHIGSQISQLAFPALFLALTGSPAQTGLMTATRALPYVLFGLPAGALIDRWDRRRVMLICDAGRALALGSIPLAMALDALSSAQLYIVAFVEGTLFIFFSLAETACLPQVVEKAQIPEATARQFVTESASGVIGPSLFGVLMGLGGAALPFLTDAVSYALSIVSLLLIRRSLQERRAPAPLRLRAEIAEGIAWLWGHPLIRYLALLVGGLHLASSGYVLIVLVLAKDMGISDVTLGLIFAAGGVGALLGALLIGPLQRRFSFSQLLPTATWVWAMTWLPFALAPSALALALALAASFVIVPIHSTVHFGYRIARIPDRLQGRVNSAFRLILFGCQAISLALTGVLLQWLGAVPTVLVLFVPQAALALATQLNRHVRNPPQE